ncbi:hypothetical protein K440DRAFT_289711, partial [Wilcoxina mikolae CBS 423.85]
MWTYSWKGETIVLRDVADKILAWVTKFQQIGDIAVQYDPTHAALPWAAFRFVLQCAVGDSQKRGELMVGLEVIANVLARGKIYETLYLVSGSRTNGLEDALVGLYASALAYLARAKRYFGHASGVRVVAAVFDIGGLSTLLEDVNSRESVVQKEVAIAEAQYQRSAHQDLTDGMGRLRSILKDLERPIERIESKVMEIHDGLQEAQRIEILKWLSPVIYEAHHDNALQGRTSGTGEWLLRRGEFVNWRSSDKSAFLWLHGEPGAGKTKLVALVIETLRRSWNLNSEALAYFYCNRDEADRNKPEVILRILLRQLAISEDGPLLQPLVVHYQMEKKKGFPSGPPGVQKCLDLILETVDCYSRATFVIDALDECDRERREALFDALKTIQARSKCVVHLFVSSRRDRDIRLQFASVPKVSIRATDNADDIEHFVREEVASCIEKKRLLGGDVDSKLREEVICTLISKADGMFLWVSLQIQHICRMSIESDVRKTLGTLPKTLHDTYAAIFELIEMESESGPRLAKKAMLWVMACVRPVSPDELSEAVSLSEGLPVSFEVLLELCHNFLVIDHQLNCIRFGHLSVHEFLEKTHLNVVDAHQHIA